MERKAITADPKLKILSESGNGTLGMYLSTFHNWDRVRPIPERPARDGFEKYLDVFLRDGFITEHHEWGKRPIATPFKAFADDYGLWVEAEYHSTDEAQQSRITSAERLARGKSVKSSMGYQNDADELVPINDPDLEAQGIKEGRILKDILLFEGSVVNVPMNPLADVSSVKGILPVGLPMDAHSDAVLAAVNEYTGRVKSLATLRLTEGKEGRVLSTTNRAKLNALLEALTDVRGVIEELLAASEPKAKPDEVRKAIADYLALELGILQGVTK